MSSLTSGLSIARTVIKLLVKADNPQTGCLDDAVFLVLARSEDFSKAKISIGFHTGYLALIAINLDKPVHIMGMRVGYLLGCPNCGPRWLCIRPNTKS